MSLTHRATAASAGSAAEIAVQHTSCPNSQTSKHSKAAAAHLRVARDEHGVVVREALQAVEGVERLAALQDGHCGLHSKMQGRWSVRAVSVGFACLSPFCRAGHAKKRATVEASLGGTVMLTECHQPASRTWMRSAMMSALSPSTAWLFTAFTCGPHGVAGAQPSTTAHEQDMWLRQAVEAEKQLELAGDAGGELTIPRTAISLSVIAHDSQVELDRMVAAATKMTLVDTHAIRR